MSDEGKQWRILAIEALQFIGELARDCPVVKTRCERFAANAYGEHCGPLITKEKPATTPAT